MAKPKVPTFKAIVQSKIKSVTTPKAKSMDLPNLTKFLGARTTAQSAAEGRLKIAAKSKVKKAAIKKAVAKKKKKSGGFLNLSAGK